MQDWLYRRVARDLPRILDDLVQMNLQQSAILPLSLTFLFVIGFGSLLLPGGHILSFECRDRQPELMDQPTLDCAEHLAALKGLARIHKFTGTAARFWKSIQRLENNCSKSPIRILDVGCGDGELLRQLHHKAQRDGVAISLSGCDFSDNALQMARDAAQAEGVSIDFHIVDVTCNPLPVEADVIVCSLFLHHFDEKELIIIFEQFAHSARELVLIEDLKRSRLGYGLCWVGTRLLSRSHVVHVDGLLSVRAAFSILEISRIVQNSKLASAKIEEHWPERFTIRWCPDGE